MKKRVILSGILLFLFFGGAGAQDNKLRVAVFDPAVSGSVFDEGAGVIIREMVSSTLVNTGKYTIIERSLIDKILKEQKFANSGAVDDTQISQLGKLAGANKVILSVLSSAGNKGLLSLKMIDVESASIESQKTQLVDQSKIYDNITVLALEVIGESSSTVPDTGVVAERKESGTKWGAMIGLGRGARTAETPTAQDDKNRTAEASAAQSDRNRTAETSTIQSDRNRFAERMNLEEGTDFSVSTSASAPAGDSFALVFAGARHGKNPDARIYVDDVYVGSGTLNGGFSLACPNNRPGRCQIKIDWSGMVASKTYDINTDAKKRFEFEFVKTGFGYEFQLKK